MVLSLVLSTWLALFSLLPHRSDAEFEDFANLAIRIDNVLDNSNMEIQGVRTQEDVEYWVNETIPFFVYEDITYFPQYPEEVTFEYYDTGREHIHLLGTTQCFQNTVTLNERFQNPVSPLYNDAPTSISTLVHELAHVQGICFSGGRIEGEAMAQLATLEVLAAMANRGNVEALYVFLDELRYMLVTGALIAAQQEGKDHSELVQAVYGDDPLMMSRLEKSSRYWQEHDPERYLEIVEWYNYQPMFEVLSNLHKETIGGLLYPINHYCSAGYTSYYELSPFDYHKCLAKFKIDDIAYIINHLEEMGAVLEN